MRVVLAGTFVFLGILLPIITFPSAAVSGFRVIPFGLGMGLYVCLLCLIAQVVFNLQIRKTRDLYKPSVDEMDQQGLLISTDFQATRAFKIEAGEDEGPYYFIELQDASILYLNGQYLYDYEGDELLDDDKLEGEPRTFRRFPCTDFTIQRHRTRKNVLDLLYRGRLIPLETVEPTDPVKVFDIFHPFPQDGQIITDWTYDTLRLKMGGARHS